MLPRPERLDIEVPPQPIAREGLADGSDDRLGHAGEVVARDLREIECGQGGPFQVGFARGLGWHPGWKWDRGGRHCIDDLSLRGLGL